MAIGLDLDGTIIDSLSSSARWLSQAATLVNGSSISEAEVRKHFGKPELALFKELLTASKAEEAFAQYQKILIAECIQMPLYTGVRGTLSFLQEKGVPMAIFTSRGAWATNEILEQHQLKHFFSLVLAGDEVENVKPAPEGILKMCAHFNVSPAHFIYVGDSPTDIIAAERAGANGYQAMWADKVQPYGERKLHSIGELRSLISS